MPIVRMDQRVQPMTRQRKERPVIRFSTNAEKTATHKRRLASTASLFPLKDRFAASHCVT